MNSKKDQSQVLLTNKAVPGFFYVKKRYLGPVQYSILLLIGMILGVNNFAQAAAVSDPTTEPLLTQDSLVFQGSFNLPSAAGHGGPSGSGFDYAKTAMTYYPAHNSLLINGHIWYGMTAEISIPTGISLSTTPTGKFLQDFSDIAEGNRKNILAGGGKYDDNVEMGGLLVYNNKLISNYYGYYDSSNSARQSFFTHNLNLSKAGTFSGMFQLGPANMQSFVSGYMALIPPQWQTLLGAPAFAGQSGVPIIFRQSLGPAAYAFNPDDLGVKIPAPTIPLVGYPIEHPTLGTYSDTSLGNDYTQGTLVKGAAFPVGSRSVLFFGSQGLGINCYGIGMLLGRAKDNSEIKYRSCYGANTTNHGNGSAPFRYWVWAYDANDLLAVKNGQKNSWDIKPYATWPLDFPASDGGEIQGVGYDPATQTIYISRPILAWGHWPIISVFHVNLTPPVRSDNTAPSTPPGLSVVSSTSNEVNLAWNSSTDNVGVVGYKIFRNGKMISIEHQNSFKDYNIIESTNYTYTVSAYDLAGNNSMPATVSATTHSKPSRPTNLTVTPSGSQVNLSWSRSVDDFGIQSAYYRIYRDNTPQFEGSTVSTLAIVNTNSYVDTEVVPGTTYSYHIVAMDAGAKLSDPSATVSTTGAVIPAPSPAPAPAPTPDPSGNNKDRANSYDDAWQNAWVANAKAILAGGVDQTPGKVLWIGDSLTRDPALGAWAQKGAGKTAEDQAITTWMHAGLSPQSINSSDGFALATPYTCSNRSFTVGDGLGSWDFMGASSMPADINPVTAKQKLLNCASYPNGLNLTTMLAAIPDAQFAIVEVNLEATNPGVFTDFQRMVDLLISKHVVPIIITYTYRISSNINFNGWVDQYNAALRQYAQTKKLPLIDLNNEMLARLPFAQWGERFLSGDGVHYTRGNAQYPSTADPYANGGNAATHATGLALTYNGYGLKGWLGVQKMKEIKAAVVDSLPLPSPSPIPAVDTTAPTVPTDLSASSVSSSQINLTWTASKDNVGVSRYIIYRNGAHVATSVSTSYSDTNLLASTTYAYTISAYDLVGNNSAQSASATAKTTAPLDVTTPTVPHNLSAAAVSSSQIVLAWNASTDNVGVTGYKIFRESMQIATSAVAAYSDNNLLASTNYTYMVLAYDAAGNSSAQSASVGATTLAQPLPEAPTRLLATPASYKSINLSWNAGARGAPVVGYYVYRDGIQIATTQTTSYTDTDLILNTPYSYTVVAYDARGNKSPPSVGSGLIVLTKKVNFNAPSVPSGLSATGVTPSRIDLSWGASSDDIQMGGYRIFRNGIPIAITESTSYSDNGLSAATSYSYTVSAYDRSGNNSEMSNTASARTKPPADALPPSIPNGLGASVISISQIDLNWNASADNLAMGGYKIFRNGAQIADTSSTSYSDTGLSESTNYSYTVLAYDAVGNASAQSAAVIAKTKTFVDVAAPSVPAGLTATPISSSQIDLRWNASIDNVAVTGYKIFRGGVQITVSAAANYSDRGLSASTNYSYTVLAYDAAGNASVQSAAVNAKTYAPPDVSAPTVPTGLTTAVISDSQINLSWNVSTDNVAVTGYKLFRNGVQVISTAATVYSDIGLSQSTNYSYTVLSYDAAGNASVQSAAVIAKTKVFVDVAAPSVPAGLTATPISSSQIDLRWNASIDNVAVTGYKIFRGGVQITVSAVANYSDKGLNASTNYSYTVLAYDAANNASAQSVAVIGRTNAPPDVTAPTVPRAFAASVISDTKIDLSWTASADNVGVAGYKIFRNGSQIAVSAVPSYSDTGLSPLTTYSYKVLAFDAAGNASSQSATVGAMTQAPAAPLSPNSLVATPRSFSSINLSWDAPTGGSPAAGYYIYRDGIQVATTRGRSYTDTELLLYTPYLYTVVAYDARGNISSPSIDSGVIILNKKMKF